MYYVHSHWIDDKRSYSENSPTGADILINVVHQHLAVSPPPNHMLVGGEQGCFKRCLWCRAAQHLLILTGQSRASKMVEWTDFERATIQDIFSKIDYDTVGPATLARCLVVYPWCQRYFGNFGNLYNAAAISSNPMVAQHGTIILHGLDRAVKNMDDIKNTYAELSVLHSEKLHVDPDNFKVTGYETAAITVIIYIL
ncbi:hypothetical protein PAMA_009627 [Pampus argenteus]